MTIIQTNNINQLVLTSSNTFEEIELNDNNFVLSNIREFVIGANSVFDGATLNIYRYLSDNTGYTEYLNPGTEDVLTITAAGAGRALNFSVKTGKIKFALTGASDITNVTIDLPR